MRVCVQMVVTWHTCHLSKVTGWHCVDDRMDEVYILVECENGWWMDEGVLMVRLICTNAQGAMFACCFWTMVKIITS